MNLSESNQSQESERERSKLRGSIDSLFIRVFNPSLSEMGARLARSAFNS